VINDCRLTWWLVIDVVSVLWLRCVTCDVTDISEVHAALAFLVMEAACTF
jgi:hypothetical protein